MLEGYLLQNIVIMSHLNVCCCCVFFFFVVFLQHNQNKYSHLFWICGVFQVWAIFASVKASGWTEEFPEALTSVSWSESQSDGSNKQSFITTAATRCHCCHHEWLTASWLSIKMWSATPPLVWTTEWAVGFFFPSNITIIITWNTGHMMEMNAFVMWLIKTEKCRERKWRQTATNAGWM